MTLGQVKCQRLANNLHASTGAWAFYTMPDDSPRDGNHRDVILDVQTPECVFPSGISLRLFRPSYWEERFRQEVRRIETKKRRSKRSTSFLGI